MRMLGSLAVALSFLTLASAQQTVFSAAASHQSYDSGLFSPLEDLSVLSETEFTTLGHPAFPNYNVRVKKSNFCDGTVNSYTGYIDIQARHLFFYFFESRNDPDNDDVIFWTNGGPGCSSSLGLFMELGPCRVLDSEGPKFNPYSWNSNANIFFIDQPIGVGFSYANYGEFVSTTEEAAKDIAAFVAIFFENFSKFKGRPFHMAGESYGGRYIPVFAAEVYDQNAKLVEAGIAPINLTSIMIGNGITDFYTMAPSYYDIACTPASVEPILDIGTCVRMKQAVPRCEKWLKKACVDSFDAINCEAANTFCGNEIGEPFMSSGKNPYDISKDCEGYLPDTLCYPVTKNIAHYLDLPSTRAALGIPLNDTSLPISHKNFSSCSNSVGYAFSLALDEFHPTHHHVAALLDRGVRALIYVGTYDWICNHVGNERWLVGDDFAGSWWGGERWRREDRTVWVVDGKKAGEKRSFGPLTFATIEGAGHMVCSVRQAQRSSGTCEQVVEERRSMITTTSLSFQLNVAYMSEFTTLTHQGRVHLLSKKSVRLERDTFFFRPNPFGSLIGGINQRLAKITCATLNRWGKLCDPRCPRFYLYPVALKKCGILKYLTDPTGPAIGPESTDSLEPGNYIIEVKDCDMADPFDFLNITFPFIPFDHDLKSFTELEAAAEGLESFLDGISRWNDFPNGLENIIVERDGAQCMITGSKDDLGVSWIFPPAWADFSGDKSHVNNHQALRAPSNALIMQRRLISAFNDNAFGVDVDDSYRIVVFRCTGLSKDALAAFRNEASYLCHFPACTDAQVFLRQHLRHCILVNFRGGDISEDYPFHVILETMDALGIGSDDGPDDVVPLSDPLWPWLPRILSINSMTSPAQAAPSTVHLLSKKSTRLERDTFFFRPSPYGYLIGGDMLDLPQIVTSRLIDLLGLNQRLTKATCAMLNRWAVLLDPRSPPFELCPVALKQCSILRYIPEPIGPAIPSDSTVPIKPGDYSIEEKECKIQDPFDFANMSSPFIALSPYLQSFAEIKAAAESPDSDLEEFLHWYDFPTGFEDLVSARDAQKCMITGSKERLGVTWIFPPPWANAFSKKRYAHNHQALVVPSNAMLMQRDLIPAFHDNAFGIDVDDNYRIVVFHYAEGSKEALSPFCNEPAYLCHTPVCPTMQVFLREHFRRCILVKFRGGDILEDYPSEMILETMEALGVGPDNDPDEVAPFTDPLWETPLGKEIFEDYMKVGLPSSTAQYSDEGVIEDEAFYDSWPVEDDGTTDN
ncbi:hypothetical protein CVT26_002865 [Gymnopilus dilepis]|uniref:Carboxypeptidase n=1 Tax=Gymnopilus dilepis TaxID=231916 RepID=A0A409VT48_9AGAR|nr:hypothetical protein CVT26_002865 [Gymnopilus dilepis]